MPTPLTFSFLPGRFSAANKELIFSYRISFAGRAPLLFTERIILPSARGWQKLPTNLRRAFFQDLSLALGISYYKTYCPKRLLVPFGLTKEQAKFWTAVYQNGLGEFAYKNNLNPWKLARFTPTAGARRSATALPRQERALVSIGGGKDSIVAAEFIRAERVPFATFTVSSQRPSPIIEDVMREIGAPRKKLRRTVDPQLASTMPGSFNGHIPITMINAFLGVLLAALEDFRYVVFANEASANVGNHIYRGREINHQWSKSQEFETLFQNHIRTSVTQDISLFSITRPLTELRTIQEFARLPRYFTVFSSCNRNFSIFKKRNDRRWCGECEKCAFTFLALAAFLPKKTVVGIFGKNLLDEPVLLPTYADLLGFGRMKPFECVGTFEENQVALHLASKQFSAAIAVKTFAKRLKDIPTKTTEVFHAQPAPTLPDRFRFAGMRTALLLGFGIEGHATKRFLQKNYPALHLGVADKKDGKNYLQKQKGFDLALRTPGLPMDQVTIPSTTATNIFFSRAREAMTIGVTGSKGKSTTAALIAHILKTAGKPVQLLGNIGKPMLSALPVQPKTYYVLELSSYQLEDARFSPRIAVVTALFPEHMNHHGGLLPYYAAKHNIVAHQKPGDLFIYNPSFALLRQWAKSAPGKAMRYTHDFRLPADLQLIGEHNADNALAAVTVARQLGISDATITKALRTFHPLPHRLQHVATRHGISFFDDAISTTPESTIMALRALPNVKTIFLGGEDRGYDFRKLEKEIRRIGVENVVLFPDSGRRMFMKENKLRILRTRSMQAAVTFAYRHTPRGSICLLSTASPSYSLWKNFEEKGDEFQKFVRQKK